MSLEYMFPKKTYIVLTLKSLTKCDILAQTETELLCYHSDNTNRETLHPYTIHRQDHTSDKYSSLAICTKENSNVLQK